MFTLEINGPLAVRIPTAKYGMGNDILMYNEIPMSKFFGYIAEHIFETIRECNNSNDKIDMTMKELFENYPIEYSIVYKNNSEIGQGKSLDISDYSVINGKGYGNKPSSMTRQFDKQVVLLFKFKDEPDWLETFTRIWNKRQILLKGYYDIPNKSVYSSLDDVTFDFDTEKIYYTYDFEKSDSDVLSPKKMLYMFNTKNIDDSIYVENIERIQFFDSWDLDDLKEELSFKLITDMLGE